MNKLVYALAMLVVALAVIVTPGVASAEEYATFLPVVKTGNFVSIEVLQSKCGEPVPNANAGVDFFDDKDSVRGTTDSSGVFAASGENNSLLIYVIDAFGAYHLGWAGPVMRVTIEYCGGETEVIWPFPDGE
jgi:hypothetical protein